MSINSEIQKIITEGQQMYFDDKITKSFIEHERDYVKNPNHIGVSRVFEAILMKHIKNKENQILANLGAGACPDEFNTLLDYLKKSQSRIYWEDHSKTMITEARKNLPEQFMKHVDFQDIDMLEFLEKQQNQSIDVIFMQYTFNYIVDLESFFDLVNKKLKIDGIFIANPNIYPKGLKHESTNAFYAVNDVKIDDNQVYFPKNGDIIKVMFKTRPDIKDILCYQNIIYYDKENILSQAKKVFGENGKLTISWYDDWQENKDYLKEFINNTNNKILIDQLQSTKTFFVLEKNKF